VRFWTGRATIQLLIPQKTCSGEYAPDAAAAAAARPSASWTHDQFGTSHRHYDRKVRADPDRHSFREQDRVIACVRASPLGIYKRGACRIYNRLVLPIGCIGIIMH
jgi:hypothetical protein